MVGRVLLGLTVTSYSFGKLLVVNRINRIRIAERESRGSGSHEVIVEAGGREARGGDEAVDDAKSLRFGDRINRDVEITFLPRTVMNHEIARNPVGEGGVVGQELVHIDIRRVEGEYILAAMRLDLQEEEGVVGDEPFAKGGTIGDLSIAAVGEELEWVVIIE